MPSVGFCKATTKGTMFDAIQYDADPVIFLHSNGTVTGDVSRARNDQCQTRLASLSFHLSSPAGSHQQDQPSTSKPASDSDLTGCSEDVPT